MTFFFRWIGNALPDTAAATIVCYAGYCTATVSVSCVDRERIELELQLTSSRAPRESSLTIKCRWERFGAGLADGQHVDLSRSPVRPVGRCALIRALLGAVGRADIDLHTDRQLLKALEGAVVTARVRVDPASRLVFGTDASQVMRPLYYRVEYTPVIVRFLRWRQ